MISASLLSFTQILLYGSTDCTLSCTVVSGDQNASFHNLHVKFFPMAPSLARGPPIFCGKMINELVVFLHRLMTYLSNLSYRAIGCSELAWAETMDSICLP